MVWDGDCGFCKLCANRFSNYKDQKVELIPYQSLNKKYEDEPKKNFSMYNIGNIYLLQEEITIKGPKRFSDFSLNILGEDGPFGCTKNLNFFLFYQNGVIDL